MPLGEELENLWNYPLSQNISYLVKVHPTSVSVACYLIQVESKRDIAQCALIRQQQLHYLLKYRYC